MKTTLLLFCSVMGFLFIGGCESPQTQTNESEMDMIKDLTVQGLRDTSQDNVTKENLMNFRILTYTIVPGAADELEKVFSMLSQDDVRAQDRGAFTANGLAIGTASSEQGPAIARKLTEIGAVRGSSMRLIVPPVSQEIVSKTLLNTAEKLTYANTSTGSIKMLIEPGFMGWILSAKPDPRFRGMVQVNLFPAHWQTGIENIRLLMGKDPVEFQPFNEGRALVRIEERGFLLIGPARDVPDQMTLDKMLFFVPGAKPTVRFFVIICDSAGI